MPQYRVKLRQQEWITTEVFEPGDTTVFGEPPTTKGQAKKLAQAFIDEHKDLADRTYELEVEEIADPEPEQTLETPAETEQNIDSSPQETNIGETQNAE